MRATLTACTAALALAVSGCGGGDDDRPTKAVGAPLPSQPDAKGTYPSSIAHAFGLTEIKRKPKRIVTIGVNDQDAVLALGAMPIAVTDWGSGEPSATRPWARMLLGQEKPTVLDARDGFDFDAVAALKPDLIVAINAGLSYDDYQRFAKIAPTLGPDQGSTNGYASQWSQPALAIAAAIGRMDRGDALVADTQKRFAAVAAAHPEFAGRVATLAQGRASRGAIRAYPDRGRFEVLTMLGFRANTQLAPADVPVGGLVRVPRKRLALLDTDVAVFATQSADDLATLGKLPELAELKVVKDGRAVFTDAALGEALSYPSPLSLRYALDHLTPLLERAVEGKAPRGLQRSPGT